MQVWEFTEYKPYLLEKLGPEGSRNGLRKKLATQIQVHTSFLSQVLKGANDFSLEQAESINTFLGHTEEEGEFFILLVLKARAGSQALSQRFEKRIADLLRARHDIKNRIGRSNTISEKDREKFYSSSIYGALHVLAAIPEFQNLESLAQALKLPRSRVRSLVDFMIGIGLLSEEKGTIMSTTHHVHLDNQSELILKHHANWRYHTISNLQFLDREDLHYSACLSLSHHDVVKLKESILENLKSNIEIVSKSKEETAYVLCYDFYKLA
jgi:uncharacterized protein (TIGR02147 family)